jgi:homopolymeric O-antigen transport system ATP-binding protein
MSETLVKVEGVSKKFCRDLKRSLWYGMKDLGSELLGRSHNSEYLRKDEFWAVKDVSFELNRGECLGLIGRNGAGKTTLLRMLNGLIKPDKGRIEMHGRVGALIALGTGFNPILTGRENIYVNASVLGLNKKEIDSKFDEIVEFAELGEFIDAPVQSYSSGMQVRLGFAIATSFKPDILLLDEVLAVGDIGFRAKCFNVISKIINNSAVIFVSHNMPEISRICSSVNVLNKGETIFQGKDIGEGIDCYHSFLTPEEAIITGNNKVTIHSITLESNYKKNIDTINYMDNLTLHFDIKINASVKSPVLYVNISNQSLQTIAQCNSFYNKFEFINAGKRSIVTVNLGSMNLNPGLYYLSASILEGYRDEVLMRHMYFKSFKVTGGFLGYAPVQINGKWSIN